MNSSPELTITYRRLRDIVGDTIKFKSSQERDEAFSAVTEVLGVQYDLELYKPKKWTKVLSHLYLLFIPGLLYLVALWARDIESGRGLGLDTPGDNLERIATLIAKLTAFLGVLIGSKILYILSVLSFLMVAGWVIYLAVSIPAELPTEKRLRHRERDPMPK